MIKKRFLFWLLISCGFIVSVYSQPLPPKIETLVKEITSLTYSNKYDSAQTLVLQHLERKNLSDLEIFYGHYLFGDILKSSGKPRDAIKQLLNSKDFLNKIPDKTKYESLIYGNIAECYFDLLNYQDAKKQAQLSLQTNPGSSSRAGGHAVNYIILGYSDYLEKKYQPALNYYHLAIKEYITSGETCELPLCYMKIAKVYNGMGNEKLAMENINKAIFISDSCRIENYKLLSKRALFDMYKENGNYKKALEQMLEINEMVEKLEYAKQGQLMSELEVKYKMKLVQNENKTLEQINQKNKEVLAKQKKTLIITILAGLILVVFIFLLIRVSYQRKNAEEKLKQFQHFFTNSYDLACIANMQGYFEILNPNWEKALGYSEKELLENQFLTFIHPDDIDSTLREIEKLKTGAVTINFVNRYRKKDGTYLWFDWNSTPDPATGKLYAIARDITGRKKAEEQIIKLNAELEQKVIDRTHELSNAYEKLKLSEKKFRDLFENNPMPMWVLDLPAFRIMNVNESAVKHYGYSREEFLGMTALDLRPAEEKKRFIQLDRSDSLPHSTGVWKHLKKDGTIIQAEINVSQIVFDGKPARLVLSNDVTEKIKAEEKLVKSESQIRNFASHINKVLEDERAHIAREIHDDIGQQLAGIKIGLALLKKKQAPFNSPEGGKLAHAALPLSGGDGGGLGASLDGMMRDVDDTIQSLRKIATELRPGILDSLGLIPSIRWLAREFEKKTNIKCFIETQAKEQLFEKNLSTCFFRICQESLTNISKHANASEVIIEITQNPPSGGRGALVLSVSDNGKGISSEKLDNPFSMGLLGMRERANIIGGELQITSQKNKGTTIQLKAVI